MQKQSPKPKAAPVFDPHAHGYGTPGAAWYLAKSQITMRKWRVAGSGPVFRVINGRAWYAREDLDAFIAGHSRYRSTSDRTVAESAAA